MGKHGVKVTYITGNHDEFIRPFVSHVFSLGTMTIANQAQYTDITGRKLLITHGDMFDGITRLAPWIGFLGDKAYDAALWINTHYNWWRHKMGFGYWSLSQYLKQKVKKGIDFVFKFENTIVEYCVRHGYDGVICGHIHTPEMKMIDGTLYMNDGDWVESCSALVEDYKGNWSIVYWNNIV